MIRLLALVATLLTALALPASAHRTELAVLEIAEITPGTYAINWEIRPNTELQSKLEPIFPPQCTREDLILDCGAEGLVGEIGFELLGAGQSAAMFKIRDLEGRTQLHTLTPAQPSATVSRTYDAESWAGLGAIFSAYLQIGVEHILAGVDHLLFVLGLVWVAAGGRMLLKTITAFTVAHSITLAAVTFGWVGVPETFVNAMIALSIVFIGVEVLNAQAGRSTLTLRNPWAVAFFFGLLHGFGFANALVALGLPEDARPLALLAFNVGVEIGQIAFVGLVLAMAWGYRTLSVGWPGWSRPLPAYAIGGLAAFWFFDRLAALSIGA